MNTLDHNQNIKLSHAIIVKAPGLLPMFYTVAELAEEVGMPERTLRDWIAQGAPAQRDSRQHIWINGLVFAEWVKSFHATGQSRKIGENEAYCFRCKAVVPFLAPEVQVAKRNWAIYRGICPHCQNVIHKGGRHG